MIWLLVALVVLGAAGNTSGPPTSRGWSVRYLEQSGGNSYQWVGVYRDLRETLDAPPEALEMLDGMSPGETVTWGDDQTTYEVHRLEEP